MLAPSNDDVTVVIPCFNYGVWLPEAVASVLGQEGGAPRIIVVDDGSTDPGTHRVLDELETGGEVEVVRQANAGAAAARNTGLALARSPFVMNLDADDALPPSAIAQLRTALQDDPSAGFAYGPITFFGDWTGVMSMPPYDPWRLLFRHIIGPTALMRRELIEATGGYDASFRNGGEDWEIWVHALALGITGRKIEQVGLRQRRHGPSKLTADRLRYHEYFNRIRTKHAVLYQGLAAVRRASECRAVERALYRYLWGPRPWPPQLEQALYALHWRSSPKGAGPIATSTTAR